MKIVNILILPDNETGQRLLDQTTSFHAQHSRSGAVDLQDYALLTQCEVSNRRKVIFVKDLPGILRNLAPDFWTKDAGQYTIDGVWMSSHTFMSR
jgi:hypothetical protein